MNGARVLISIVSYNSSRFITGCIEAVLKQSIQDFVVVIYDNHSTDETLSLIEQYSNEKIILQKGQENIGFGAAHNWIIGNYPSEFILLLNPDASLSETFIEHALGCFNTDVRIGSVAGLLLADNSPDAVIDCAGITFTRSRRFKLRFGGSLVDKVELKQQFVDGVDGAVAMYRRDAAESIMINQELFDSTYFLYGEDWDVAWRLQLAGWRCMFVPEAVACHYRVFKQRSFADRRKINKVIKYHSFKNSLASVIKNDDSYNFLRDFLFICKRFIFVFAYSLIFEFYSLKAIPYILGNFRKILETRRAVQAKRRVGPRDIRKEFILEPVS